MDKKSVSTRRRAAVAAVVSVLIVLPALALAAPGDLSQSRGRSIFNMVIERLCQIQQAHGNRIQLIDPARCVPVPPPPPALGRLVVDKVTEPSGSTREFSILASGTGIITGGGVGTTTDSTNKEYEVTAGTYSVSETVPAGWVQVSNTCSNVVVGTGETKTCTITNRKLGTITLTKVVVNDNGGTATSSDFTIHLHQMVGETMVDVAGSPQAGSAIGTTYSNLASSTYHVAESATTTYTASFSGDCDVNGVVTLAAGDVKSCTITNDDVPQQVEGKLLITEVLYDLASTTSQGNEPENEWVEIHNGTNAGINLAGYFIHDASSADALPSVLLPAGKFAVISGSSTTQTFWSIPNDAVVIVLSNATIGNGLANGGDMVWLENTASTTVDAVSWGSNTTAFNPSVPASPDGNSIMRTSLTTDTDTAADWADSATPTPGT